MIVSGEIELAAKRGAMKAYRLAIRKAMLMRPGPEGFASLLDYVDFIAAHPDTPRAAREAWDNAVEMIRLHPDVAEWGPAAGLDDAALDALFLDAMQIERGDL